MFYVIEGPFQTVAGSYCRCLLTFTWSAQYFHSPTWFQCDLRDSSSDGARQITATAQRSEFARAKSRSTIRQITVFGRWERAMYARITLFAPRDHTLEASNHKKSRLFRGREAHFAWRPPDFSCGLLAPNGHSHALFERADVRVRFATIPLLIACATATLSESLLSDRSGAHPDSVVAHCSPSSLPPNRSLGTEQQSMRTFIRDLPFLFSSLALVSLPDESFLSDRSGGISETQTWSSSVFCTLAAAASPLHVLPEMSPPYAWGTPRGEHGTGRRQRSLPVVSRSSRCAISARTCRGPCSVQPHQPPLQKASPGLPLPPRPPSLFLPPHSCLPPRLCLLRPSPCSSLVQTRPPSTPYASFAVRLMHPTSVGHSMNLRSAHRACTRTRTRTRARAQPI